MKKSGKLRYTLFYKGSADFFCWSRNDLFSLTLNRISRTDCFDSSGEQYELNYTQLDEYATGSFSV